MSRPSNNLIDALLAAEYGLNGSRIKRLAGENENFLITASDDRRFVLKFAGEGQDSESFELEHVAIESAHNAELGLELPRFITTLSGRIEGNYDAGDGRILSARLIEFVRGTAWCDAGTARPEQLYSLGRTLGTLDLELATVQHRAAHRTHRWDLSCAAQHRNSVTLVEDPGRRRMLEWFFHLYSACASPSLKSLPHSLIHADANDENILLRDGKITGLLDFGDCLYNPTVCELAIALPYAMFDQSDPLEAGAEVVAGYHGVRPLCADEVSVLYPLVCGRMCVTTTVAAQRRQIDPEHASWFATEERAWQLLDRLFATDPADATKAFSQKLGLSPPWEHGQRTADLITKRRLHTSASLSVAYDDPLAIVRGRGQYLYDNRGRPFLDLVNNVCHVGHCHPRVVEAGQKQMAQLNTNTRYLHHGFTDYAERLCATLPKELDTCFLVNSGTEANELALRLARTHTGRHDFLVVDGAYHGHTSSLIDISPYKFMGKGGMGKAKPWVHVVPLADGYRGKYRGYDATVGAAYGDEVERVIRKANRPIAGFISESLLSCGGQVIPPEGYLDSVFQHVRAAGGVCILDEVQVGFGRVGTHFWAFEEQGVVPDIVVMGKPMGNGHPMGAVVTTREIAESFATGMEFFSTFGGNPVSCVIGLAVLDVIRDEELQQHALETGSRFLGGLRGLMMEHSMIGDVRGAGLFIGVELVRGRATLEPAAEKAEVLINRMKNRGMLLSTDGPFHNVLKIKPPMVLTNDDVDMVVRVLDDELSHVNR
jgi:4-aminobutyrate aminotransferase-like enzyme/Ser/Thr protein kinase RdoA (MazF antagonist)